MSFAIRAFVLPLLLLPPPCAGAGEASRVPGEGFAGTWSLAATADDVGQVPQKRAWEGLGGTSGPTSRPGGGFDLPLEVLADARLLVVTDDGAKLEVVYPSGRRRSFVTDGERRYVDDGDGPADVVARRKDGTVTVASEWKRGYRLRETWEVRSNPRRLVVTAKLRGRESHEYVRTYSPPPPGAAGPIATPAPPVPPSPTPAVRLPWPPPEPPPPSSSPSTATVEPPAGPPRSVDRLAECTIRPPKGARPAELRGLAKVRQEEAGRSAISSVAPHRPAGTLTSDPEVFDGCLVWPVTLRLPALGGVQEVFVDAGDGTVVKSDFVRLAPASSGGS